MSFPPSPFSISITSQIDLPPRLLTHHSESGCPASVFSSTTLPSHPSIFDTRPRTQGEQKIFRNTTKPSTSPPLELVIGRPRLQEGPFFLPSHSPFATSYYSFRRHSRLASCPWLPPSATSPSINIYREEGPSPTPYLFLHPALSRSVPFGCYLRTPDFQQLEPA